MDDTVDVERRADGSFEVSIRQGSVVSRHAVTVPPGLAADLGHPEADPKHLVATSVSFLLEREPASSILRRFGLEEVERYFPEYRNEMRRRLA